jgi:hypothetical protein
MVGDRLTTFISTKMIVTTVMVFAWFSPIDYSVQTDFNLDFRLFFPPWNAHRTMPTSMARREMIPMTFNGRQ